MEIATLADAWRAGWRLSMHCAQGRKRGMKSGPLCTYKRELDLDALICTRGGKFELSMLPERLMCPRCGSRRIRVIYEPPAQPVGVRIPA